MRLAFISDTHLGNHRRFGAEWASGINTRCAHVMKAISLARRILDGNDQLVVLGDLFDVADPTPQVVRAAQVALGEGPIIIRGNHDMVSSKPDDDALGPLRPLCQVFTEPTVRLVGGPGPSFCNLILVPFQVGPAAEWFPKAVVECCKSIGKTSVPKVLAFHLGISDEKTPPWLRGAHDSIPIDVLDNLMATHGIQWAFCGNWHEHKHWKPVGATAARGVVQVGTLAPTGFDNPGAAPHTYGQMVTLDLNEPRSVFCTEIPGPRFVKMAHTKLGELAQADAARRLEAKKRADIVRNSLYLEISCPEAEEQQAREQARQLAESGVIVNFDVVTDKTRSLVAARQAALSARSAGSLEEALVEYVARMPLEPGVSRENVLGMSKDFYAGAGR